MNNYKIPYIIILSFILSCGENTETITFSKKANIQIQHYDPDPTDPCQYDWENPTQGTIQYCWGPHDLLFFQDPDRPECPTIVWEDTFFLGMIVWGSELYETWVEMVPYLEEEYCDPTDESGPDYN